MVYLNLADILDQGSLEDANRGAGRTCDESQGQFELPFAFSPQHLAFFMLVTFQTLLISHSQSIEAVQNSIPFIFLLGKLFEIPFLVFVLCLSSFEVPEESFALVFPHFSQKDHPAIEGDRP